MEQIKLQAEDILVRALKTFLQAAFAGWAVTGFQLDKGTLIGVLAAAVSAVWNSVKAAGATK